jgi:ADP-ribose pyrophosphatase YjhB (NUDIX family)
MNEESKPSKVEIKLTNTSDSGEVFNVTYRDMESEADIEGKKVSAVHAICFNNNKMVIVYSERKGIWTPPGGGVDGDETALEATTREVKEESNMKILEHRFIGYQDITGPDGTTVTQVRSMCIVEPYGDFLGDPDDGEITEVKLIDPKDYKQYFDWGEIGERVVQRAVELKNGLVQ